MDLIMYLRILVAVIKILKKTANEYHGRSLLPCKSKSEAYRINKESVQTHSRSLCVRNIGHKTHYKCSDDRSDDGSQKTAPHSIPD